jgi:hypothetical protein
MTDLTEATPPTPARRRRLFEGPLLWIGLIAFGLALAAVLSFLPARGDTASAKPDVDAYCAQVGVLTSTDLLSLVAGITAGPAVGPGFEPPVTGPPVPTTTGPSVPTATGPDTAPDQLEAFEQRLQALERVAPHEVRTDVHEVRLAVDDVLASLRRFAPTGGIPPSSLLFTVSDAQSQIQQAIGRLADYTRDTCGIDVESPAVRSSPFGD